MIISASSFSASLPELDGLVDGVELYLPKLGLYQGGRLAWERVEELVEALSTCNLSTSVHAPYYSEYPGYPAELRVDTANMGKKGFRLLEESIDFAVRVDAGVVVVHPGIRTLPDSFERMVGNLRRLAGFAVERGVVLALENKEGTDPRNLCCEVGELVRAVELVPGLGVTLDIGHANLTCQGDQERLREFVRQVRDLVVHLHVHDNPGSWQERYGGDLHLPPGEGVIDFRILEELDFQGVYNLEVFSREDVKNGKRFLQNQLNGKTI